MNRKFIVAFAIVSLVVALAAASAVVLRVLAADRAGRSAALADFERLSSLLAPVHGSGDLADPGLRARLTYHYKSNPSLLLIAVYERGSGMRWRIPARSEYLPASENAETAPEISYPPESALRVSSSLKGDPTGKLAVDALYATVSQRLVFVAFRDALLALGAYLALASIALALSTSRRGKAAEAGEGETTSWHTRLGDVELNIGAGPSAGAGESAGAMAGSAAGAPASAPPRLEEEEFDIPDMREPIGAGLGPELSAPGGSAGHGGTAGFAETMGDAGLPAAAGASDPAGSSVGPGHRIAAAAAVKPDASETGGGETPVGLYSPASGLGWERYLRERLDAELARSASFEQDLSLLCLVYDRLGSSPDGYAVVTKAIRDFFSFRDLAFEQGVDGFAIILPNMDVDHALRMAEEFLKKLTFQLRDPNAPLEFLPLFIGLSSRAGRLVEGGRLIGEAATAIDKAREDLDSHIVAFRPDPDKYRLYLASKAAT